MDHSQKQAAILYIEPNRIFLYESTSGLHQLDLNPEIISDLEVINKESFYNLFKTFIDSNGILPASTVVLISPSVSFEREFAPGEKLEADIQSFLESVPFENIVSRAIKMEKKTKVISINRDIFELIQEGLDRQKFSLIAAVPLSILQETIPELSNNIDLKVILAKVDAIKQYSLLVGEEKGEKIALKKNNPLKNKRLLVLGSIFGLLLLILGFLVLSSLFSKPNLPTRASPQTVQPKPLPTVPIIFNEGTESSSSGSSLR